MRVLDLQSNFSLAFLGKDVQNAPNLHNPHSRHPSVGRRWWPWEQITPERFAEEVKEASDHFKPTDLRFAFDPAKDWKPRRDTTLNSLNNAPSTKFWESANNVAAQHRGKLVVFLRWGADKAKPGEQLVSRIHRTLAKQSRSWLHCHTTTLISLPLRTRRTVSAPALA